MQYTFHLPLSEHNRHSGGHVIYWKGSVMNVDLNVDSLLLRSETWALSSDFEMANLKLSSS
jgi:hypothetical protein